MKTIEDGFRAIKLQEEYCKICTYNNFPSKYCKEHCEVGKEIISLGKKVQENQCIYEKGLQEKWDEKCLQAVILFEEGMDYPEIAKKLRCHVSNLYRELKKREVLRVPTLLQRK
ncbi:helix-turn-helix domain-containing protein [Bacillus thuringiensis]|nr:helix-turn-helix domain-containing protein [Bacillus thuringiensis]